MKQAYYISNSIDNPQLEADVKEMQIESSSAVIPCDGAMSEM